MRRISLLLVSFVLLSLYCYGQIGKTRKEIINREGTYYRAETTDGIDCLVYDFKSYKMTKYFMFDEDEHCFLYKLLQEKSEYENTKQILNENLAKADSPDLPNLWIDNNNQVFSELSMDDHFTILKVFSYHSVKGRKLVEILKP